MRRIGRLFLFAMALTAPAAGAAGALRTAGVFSDHAVLQQGMPLPVWGSAEPGAEVRVEFGGQTKTTTAGSAGEWKVVLDPLKTHATGNRMTVSSGDERQEFRDLLVGEVWLASGQSNMQWSLANSARRLPEIKRIMEDPGPLGVRMLRVGAPDTEKPLTDLDRSKHRWQIDSPQARAGQSAVAFFFAKRLHEELGVPVGVIETSWGGKPIEGFIPRTEFERRESLKPILELADANKLDELRRIEGGVWVRNTAGLPGRIFNARLAPAAPFAVRGAIWYQAESNAGKGEDPRGYRHKMRALIEGWRGAWGQPEMPFYFVQLPSFRDSAKGWVRVREEQRRSLEVPHTGMAVAIDLRDEDIHPANKLDVGERLARWALARDYGKAELVPSGPLFESVAFEGEVARVRFAYVEDGLMVARKEGLAEPEATPDSPLREFELTGADGVWHPAQAEIDGELVLVRSDAVPDPVAVRYACRGAPPDANLYNRAGLPASPFCSKLEFLPWPAGAAD